MNAEDYYTVFDVTTAGYKSWHFPAFGLIFVVAGVVSFALKNSIIFRYQSQWKRKWFPRFYLGFALFWISLTFLGTFAQYRRAVGAMRNNQVGIVEGRVTQFQPMPYTGKRDESFVVNGIKFEYSDYGITAGFNNTASHGGPIREGLPVKIWYLNGMILRLDIKGKLH